MKYIITNILSNTFNFCRSPNTHIFLKCHVSSSSTTYPSMPPPLTHALHPCLIPPYARYPLPPSVLSLGFKESEWRVKLISLRQLFALIGCEEAPGSVITPRNADWLSSNPSQPMGVGAFPSLPPSLPSLPSSLPSLPPHLLPLPKDIIYVCDYHYW